MQSQPGSAAGRGPAAAGGADEGGAGLPEELAAITNNPQFAQLRQMVQENPALLQPMIQQLMASNPQLGQMLAQNPEILMQLLGGEGLDGLGDDDDWEGGDDPMAAFGEGGHNSTISVTPEENEAIQRVRPPLPSSRRAFGCPPLSPPLPAG
jgi:UV excision repair protein RAD23